MLPVVTPSTNQIVYGRRGVGKTHLLHYYRDHLHTKGNHFLFQLHDCQRLGSGLTAISTNAYTIAANMFSQLLNDIATQAFDSLDSIELNRIGKSTAGDAILQFQDVISRDSKDSISSHFDFRNLGDTLDAFRRAVGAVGLIIGLDEWVAIPRAAQPYFAECIKRAFFVKPDIAVKIAGVTYQTQMSADMNGGLIGFESGADVFSDIHLDNYFVWEEDKDGVQQFFAQALYNHLAEALQWPLDALPNVKAHRIHQEFFTQEKAFVELCRAAEGNCRDFLNVFRLAYFEFRRDSNAQAIGLPQVHKASENWYRQDKLRNIAGEGGYEVFLNYLIQDVIRERRSKTFMVSYRDINHPLLSRLFTARLLHPLRTTWSHPDRPGEPYHLVTIDYGCYLALQNTRAAPAQQVFFYAGDTEAAQYNDLVPLDDRRSIRRIVVKREDLDRIPLTGK